MTSYRRNLLLIAILTTQAHSTDYNNLIFFGDSLTDTGYFSPYTDHIIPEAGAFTTNPEQTWAHTLANIYGLNATPQGNGQNGNNYAAGGARAGQDTTRPFTLPNSNNITIPIPSVRSQIDSYLASHNGHANPDTLYSVWIGANDLLTANDNPEHAETIIKQAVKDNAAAIHTLHQAGAQSILVPNLPDIGLTPMAQSAPSAQQQAMNHAADSYNTLLGIALQDSPANIIPLDTYHFLQEVIAAPQQYGFSNTTDTACDISKLPAQSSLFCTPATLINADAANTHVFADGIHPTGKAHRLIADYAYSVLSAAEQINAIPNAAIADANQQNHQIQQHIRKAAGHNQWWLSGNLNHHQHHNDPALRIGLTLNHDQHSGGIYVNHRRQQHQAHSGSFTLKQSGIGVYYHSQTFVPYWLNVHSAYNRLGINSDRTAALGRHTRHHHSTANGDQLLLGIRGGRDYTHANLTYTPYLGINAQHLRIDALRETAGTSSSLDFAQQQRRSISAEFGIDTNYRINPKLNLNAGFNFSHTFHNSAADLSVRLTSLASSQAFTMPVKHNTPNQRSLHLGLDYQLSPTLTISAASAWQNHNTQFQLNIRGNF